MDLQWEDPPPQPTGGNYTGAWIEDCRRELKTHPGKWARIKAYKNVGTANATAKDKFKIFGFEATVRSQEDGTGVLWARWPEV